MKAIIALALIALALAIVAVSLAFAQGPTRPFPTDVLIEYMPHPDDYRQWNEGSTVRVASGYVFVPTAVGFASPIDAITEVYFRVDGDTRATVVVRPGDQVTVVELPPGISVRAGRTFAVGDAHPSPLAVSYVWGYNAEAR